MKKEAGFSLQRRAIKWLKQLIRRGIHALDNVARKRGKAKIKISEKQKVAMGQIVDGYSEDFDEKMIVI